MNHVHTRDPEWSHTLGEDIVVTTLIAWRIHTVYPKKYAYGLCLIVVDNQSYFTDMTDLESVIHVCWI